MSSFVADSRVEPAKFIREAYSPDWENLVRELERILRAPQPPAPERSAPMSEPKRRVRVYALD